MEGQAAPVVTAGQSELPVQRLRVYPDAHGLSLIHIFYGRALDQAGMEAAAIFRIHQKLLEDLDYQEAVHTYIRRGERCV